LREADESPTPATGERYRILLEQCPQCGLVEGANEELAHAVISEAQCDAEIVDMRQGPQQGRASRTITPALRRAVLARDRGTCVVPGCKNRVYVDLHHLLPRAAGGRHTMDNIVSLCTTHHRMQHAHQMAMGRDGDTLWFEFPDGRSVRLHHPAQPDSRGSRSAVVMEESATPERNSGEEDQATALL
jgi:5-methylcytosine-specific restriction endonuclease McrA